MLISKKIKGQSILEVIVAVSLLVIMASSAIITMLGSFTITTLSKQQTRATQLASEALSASESIANQNFELLTNGTYGLDQSTGVWTLSQEPEIIDSLFTRTITISDIPFLNTKQILSVVTWKTSPIKENKVELDAHLTNWQVGKRSEPTISPEPTPVINSCSNYCLSLNYLSGICRQNPNRCTQNNETYEAGGNSYCLTTGSTSCCCDN